MKVVPLSPRISCCTINRFNVVVAVAAIIFLVNLHQIHFIFEQIDKMDRAMTGISSEQWKLVVTSNQAFERELLNWWNHCKKTGIFRNSSVVLYADDPVIYQKYASSTKITVKKAWETKTKFTNTSLSQQEKFVIGQQGFNELVSRRPSILLQEVTLGGPNVLYMDLDIILLQDPRPLFIGDYDLWATEANNKAQRSSMQWELNSGFLALRPTPATLAFLEQWRMELNSFTEADKNQPIMNKVVTAMETKGQLRYRLLLSRIFPVGRMYRDIERAILQELEIEGWDRTNSNITNSSSRVMRLRPLDGDVVAFHNNFCSSSKTCKIDRAIALGLWNESSREELL